MLAILQGACSAQKGPAKDGRKENRFMACSLDARDEIFRTLSSSKTETTRREHSVWLLSQDSEQ